jgi:hypothetical protein
MDAWLRLNGDLRCSAHHGQRGAHGDGSRCGSNLCTLRMTSSGVASPYFAELPVIQPMPTDRCAQGLLVIGDTGCAGGGGTKHCARCFPKRHEWVKERESHRQIHAPSFCFLAPKLLCLLPSFLSSLPPSRSHPSSVAMASILPTSHLQSGSDLVKLRRLLGWQSPWYVVRVRCGAILPRDLRPSEFIFFSSYALAGLMLPFSFFFFRLLETYDLQLHHVSPYSITLVVIFIHLCEMFVGVRPSVRLLWLFHVLRASEKRASRIGGYYF